MIDRSTERIAAIILTVIIVIWGILNLLWSFGIIGGNIETMDQYESYVMFATKMLLVTIPIIIASLALIPVINEDMKIVAYISYGIAIVSCLIFLFIPNSTPSFLSRLLVEDILILIVCSARTTSSIHQKYKIGIIILILITVSSINQAASDSFLSELLVGSAMDFTDSKILLFLAISTMVGILLNPCIAMITEDDSYAFFGSSSSKSKTNTNGRKENESPLEMYNRLMAEQNQNGTVQSADNTPSTEPAPVATPAAAPAPGPRPIGPNSGAVVNPIAAVVNPNPAPAAPTQAIPVEESATQAEETFEVPSSMAFLFDNTEDENK